MSKSAYLRLAIEKRKADIRSRNAQARVDEAKGKKWIYAAWTLGGFVTVQGLLMKWLLPPIIILR